MVLDGIFFWKWQWYKPPWLKLVLGIVKVSVSLTEYLCILKGPGVFCKTNIPPRWSVISTEHVISTLSPKFTTGPGFRDTCGLANFPANRKTRINVGQTIPYKWRLRFSKQMVFAYLNIQCPHLHYDRSYFRHSSDENTEWSRPLHRYKQHRPSILGHFLHQIHHWKKGPGHTPSAGTLLQCYSFPIRRHISFPTGHCVKSPDGQNIRFCHWPTLLILDTRREEAWTALNTDTLIV